MLCLSYDSRYGVFDPLNRSSGELLPERQVYAVNFSSESQNCVALVKNAQLNTVIQLKF